MILTNGDTLTLPDGVTPTRKRKEPQVTQMLPLDKIDQQHIQVVLNHTQRVISGPRGAAKILDINPNTLRSRMEKLGIKVERPDVD